jgi:hypothetical protein
VKSCLGIATSANWRGDVAAVSDDLGSILISLTLRLVSDHSLTGEGVAGVCRKFQMIAGEGVKLKPDSVG